MRRIAFAAALMFALALASVAPAFAESGGGSTGGTINVWCSVDDGTKIDLHGSLIVPDGSHGKVDLLLVGSKDGKTWSSTSGEKDIQVVVGQTTYSFMFGGNIDFKDFAEFRVIGDGTSRVINRDECGFRVPEAPASALLLLGALPAAGLIAIKATGIRLPIPHRNRIA